MKDRKRLSTALLILAFFALNTISYAQWQVDKANKFKIKIPNNWSKTNSIDGTDKVYDYYSPDQNAAIQLRVFDAPAAVTVEVLAQVYEETMLPAGSQKISLNDHTTVNGIPGKQGVYGFDYNGIPVNLAAFYTVQNGKGYALTAIIPTNMLQQKGEEVKGITHSFIIDGFSPAPAANAKAMTPNTNTTNRSGARPSSTQSSNTRNTGQPNTFIISSHEAYDFKKGKVESLAASTGGGFAVYSCTSTYPDISGKMILTNYDNFASATTWDRTALANTGRTDSKKAQFNKVYIYQLRDGSYAKFILTRMERKANHIVSLTCMAEYPASTSGSPATNTKTQSNQKYSGKYIFQFRSDNKSLVEYHFIDIRSDGTYTEEYKPKNSGNYIGGSSGTWKWDGSRIILTLDNGTESGKYIWEGDEITRFSDDKILFRFKK